MKRGEARERKKNQGRIEVLIGDKMAAEFLKSERKKMEELEEEEETVIVIMMIKLQRNRNKRDREVDG